MRLLAAEIRTFETLAVYFEVHNRLFLFLP